MSIEANKAVVSRFFELVGARRIEDMDPLLHPEFTWTIPFRADHFAMAGVRDANAAKAMLGRFFASFSEFRLELLGMTAEGDRVVLEARSFGTSPSGATYKNVYLIHVELSGGKLHRVREFFDPYQVTAYVAGQKA